MWMLDLLLLVLAVSAMGYIFFKLVFSSREAERRDQTTYRAQRFERREAERVERRRDDLGAPQGRERRLGARR